mmetsp:Transcript_5983/g.17888  ORF Transcript_5983/g.17888 Transcript_5983/m.17888 type:complete len:212 (+) Transcript_5983:339-974(+)
MTTIITTTAPSRPSSSAPFQCRVDVQRRLHEGLHAVEHLLVVELADGRGVGQVDLVAVHGHADALGDLDGLDVVQVARVPGVEHLEHERVDVHHEGVVGRHLDAYQELLEGDVAGAAAVQRQVLLGVAAHALQELVDLLAVARQVIGLGVLPRLRLAHARGRGRQLAEQLLLLLLLLLLRVVGCMLRLGAGGRGRRGVAAFSSEPHCCSCM